jgi:hypothetical protein
MEYTFGDELRAGTVRGSVWDTVGRSDAVLAALTRRGSAVTLARGMSALLWGRSVVNVDALSERRRDWGAMAMVVRGLRRGAIGSRTRIGLAGCLAMLALAGFVGRARASEASAATPLPRHSSTSVRCSPARVVIGQATSCIVTVRDTGLGPGSTPIGTVTLSTSRTGAFGDNTCQLAADGASATCQLVYTPQAGIGTHTITASYPGDTDHRSSQGHVLVSVSARTTTTTVSCADTSLDIGQATTCTATVSDTAIGQASSPAGTVSFSASQSDTFAGNPCTLVPNVGNPSSSCEVSYSATAPGLDPRALTAHYSGSGRDHSSHGSASVTEPPAAPTLDGESFDVPDQAPNLGSAPCDGPTAALQFSTDGQAFGPYAPEFAISGTVQSQGAGVVSLEARFSLNDRLGRLLAKGTMTLANPTGSFFDCEPLDPNGPPGLPASDSVVEVSATVHYEVQILTTAGVRVDSGTSASGASTPTELDSWQLARPAG